MKKVVFAVVVCVSLILGACKDKTETDIETRYTIGCLGYQYTNIQNSDWQAIESYLDSNVAFNKQITFVGKSLSGNDAQAKLYYDEQMAKLDDDYICSLINGTDYYIYGIATLNSNGLYRFVGAKKYTAVGCQDVSD